MKKVLFLTYYFPPRNRISSLRAAAFSKYLPDNGWEPVVICEDWTSDQENFDAGMLRGLENITVHRLPTSRPRGFYRFFVRNIAPYILTEKNPYHWTKLASKVAHQLCQNNSFDAILATYDPLGTLSLAASLSKTYQIPWIADLRDTCFCNTGMGARHKRKQNAKHEKRLCLKANQVVAIGGVMAKELEKELNRDVSVITNGFDPEVFPTTDPVAEERFIILFAGRIHPKRTTPVPLFTAIESAIIKGRIPEDRIHVRLLGPTSKSVSGFALDQFKRVSYSLEQRIAHKDALLQQMQSSALLLLTYPDEPGILTGKLFDYLGAGRPILAIPDDRGSISQLLSETGAGISVTTCTEIENLLVEWFQLWEKDKAFNLQRNDLAIRSYSRKEQAKQMAALLNSL